MQGELIVQDSFQVWDPKSLIRKGRDRRLFLFEMCLIFSKEIRDSAGRTKYQFKQKLQVHILMDTNIHMYTDIHKHKSQTKFLNKVV